MELTYYYVKCGKFPYVCRRLKKTMGEGLQNEDAAEPTVHDTMSAMRDAADVGPKACATEIHWDEVRKRERSKTMCKLIGRADTNT